MNLTLAGSIARTQMAAIENNTWEPTKKMVALSMSLFKRYKLKLNPEVTPGVCPHCKEMSSFVSIVNDYYKCMTCGTDVEQKINGVIKYLPIGQEKLLEKDNG